MIVNFQKIKECLRQALDHIESPVDMNIIQDLNIKSMGKVNVVNVQNVVNINARDSIREALELLESISYPIDFKKEVDNFKHELVRDALTRAGGRQIEAAKMLKLKPSTYRMAVSREITDRDKAERRGTGEIV